MSCLVKQRWTVRGKGSARGRFNQLFIGMLALLVCCTAFADDIEFKTVRGKKRKVEHWATKKQLPAVPKNQASKEGLQASSSTEFWALFSKTIGPKLDRALKDLDVTIVGYAGKHGSANAYRLLIPGSSDDVLALLKKEKSFINMIPVLLEEKVDVDIIDLKHVTYADEAKTQLKATVFFHKRLNESQAKALLPDGAEIFVEDSESRSFPKKRIHVIANQAALIQLGSSTKVKQVAAYQERQLLNEHSRELTGVTSLQSELRNVQRTTFPPTIGWLDGVPCTGDGIWICINEGIQSAHPDFNEEQSAGVNVLRKSHPSESWSSSDHGTHVAGIAAGNGWQSENETPPGNRYQWHGVAPGALLSPMGNKGDVNNHSFIEGSEGYYTSSAQYYDEIISNHSGTGEQDNNVWVWAAANNGRRSPDSRYGVQKGYYSMLVNNKNTIKVGATYKDRPTKAESSSMGPTRDGRIGPDVCAPGKGIILRYGYDFEIESFKIANSGTEISIPGIQDRSFSYPRVKDIYSEVFTTFESKVSDELVFRIRVTEKAIRKGIVECTLLWKRPEDGYMKAENPYSYVRFFFNLESSTEGEPEWQDVRINLNNSLWETSNDGWVDGDDVEQIRLSFGPVLDEEEQAGTEIRSASASTLGYEARSGTSMACPHVSGIVALMLQKYRDDMLPAEENIHDNPFWNSTAKAILIHTAQDIVSDPANDVWRRPCPEFDSGSDIATVGPDWATGYGLVNAEAACAQVNPDGFLEDVVDQGSTKRYVFTVPSATSRARVTLAWDDPAYTGDNGSSGAYDNKLVNNVDMYLFHPATGQRVYPYVLDHSSLHSGGIPADGIDSLVSAESITATAATRGVDERNNVEVVDLESPLPGEWQIVIQGEGITVDQSAQAGINQDISLVFDYKATKGGDDAHEEDDTIPQADAKGDFAEIATFYGVVWDEEYFRINIQPGHENVNIMLNFIDADDDLDMRLLDADGNPIVYATSITDNEQITTTVPSPGTYYIYVHSYQQMYGSGQAAGCEYTLQWIGDDTHEEDDTTTQADAQGDFAQGETFNGVVWDDDCYRIEVLPGHENLDIELTFTHAVDDLDMFLYNESGAVIGESDGVTDNEQIIKAVSPGTYYIRVYSYNQFDGLGGADYRLRWSGDDSHEEDDSLWVAGSIGHFPANTPHNGAAWDEDYYRIDLPTDGVIEISLQFTHGPDDLVLYLYEPSWYEVVRSDSSTDNEHIRVPVEAGTYYIGVEMYGDPVGRDYTLEWSFNHAPSIDSDLWADPEVITLPATTTVSVIAGDLDGDELTYSWYLDWTRSQGTPTFVTPHADMSEVSFDLPGTYHLGVTVSDGENTVDSNNNHATVTVNGSATIAVEGFEGGLSTFSGGTLNTDPANASEGTGSLALAGGESAQLTEDFDGSGFTQLRVDFNYVARDMAPGDSLVIEYLGGDAPETTELKSAALGSTWIVAKSLIAGTDFQVDVHETGIILIDGPFTTDCNIRFRSTVGGIVYLDAVAISGIHVDAPDPIAIITSHRDGEQVTSTEDITVAVHASDDSGIQHVHLWTREAQATTWTWHGKATGAPYEWNLGQLPIGTYALAARADANDGDRFRTEISITVVPGNSAPMAFDQSIDTPMDTAVGLTLKGADPDDDPLVFSIVSGPLNGIVTGVAPNMIYTPSAGYVGTDSFTFKVNDGITDSPIASVSVNVLGENDPRIDLVSHSDGDQVPVSQDLTLVFGASDDSGIERVYLWYRKMPATAWEFSGGDTAAPYVYNLSMLETGTYEMVARADATDGGRVNLEFTIEVVTGPTNPTVTLISHSNGDEVPATEDLILTFAASDDSGIDKVILWSRKIPETSWIWHRGDTTAPYTWNLGQLAAGTYELVARADANDGQRVNTEVSIVVVP